MYTKNAEIFRTYLLANGFEFDFEERDSGSTVFNLNQKLDNGVNIRVFGSFNKDNTMVSLYGLDFIPSIPPDKKGKICEVLNDLNDKYTFFKYVLSDNQIEVQVFNSFDNNFKSEIVMDLLIAIMRNVEEEYPNLMRAIWA